MVKGGGKVSLRLSEFRPRSELITRETHMERPRFPVIDIHGHFGYPIPDREMGRDDRTQGPEDKTDVKRLLESMDACGYKKAVNLNGFWGTILETTLAKYCQPYPDRFSIFGSIDVEGLDDDDFANHVREQIVRGCQLGMKGIKFFKHLGLLYRDSRGKFIMPNDTRLFPIWETAAEQKIPVLIHVADPVAFFKPVDGENERYEELSKHPFWSYADDRFPTFKSLLECQEELLEKNPDTTFIIAHVGSYSENLGYVSDLLDRYPNAYVDTSARFAELGRQPYASRGFFIKYQDRILYGSDFNGYPRSENIRLAYRFLETRDEYFAYDTYEIPGQGRWRIYGIGLPADVLKKVYYENAERLLS